MRCCVVKRDNIGVIVMSEELAVDCQFFVVGAEDICQFAYREVVLRSHLPEPALQTCLLMVDERYPLIA